MLAALIPILSGAVGQVAKNMFPNPEDELRRIELENQLKIVVLEKTGEFEAAAAEIIKTEAASSHWLAANWRPLMMVFFAFLIGARWFGFSVEGISEQEYLALWDIVQVGLGGYVVARTVEKVAPGVIDAMKKK